MEDAKDMARKRRQESTVVVVTGGDPPERWVAADAPPDAPVIAADSGADTARQLGLTVGRVVGDLDSLSAAARDELMSTGVTFDVHEQDKDATDLELAVTAALGHHPTRLLALGGLGGRVDHELANILLLTSAALAGVEVTLRSGPASLHVVRPNCPAIVRGAPGDLVSLLCIHGPAGGVTTSGLRWPLVDADLGAGTTLGVSNELVGAQGSVSCAEGVLLVVRPGMAAGVVPPRSSPPAPPSPEVSRDR